MTDDGRRAEVREVAAALGPVGLWSFAFDRHPVAREREALAEIEEMGWPVLWIPEGLGSKEILSHAALLLDGSRRIVVATGIASIWARDPVAMANGARTLSEAFPGRFVLGIGVSHRTSVDHRGAFTYRRPYTRMREYLDAMEEARYPVRPVPEMPPVVLAALGPRMLRLSAERAAGAHPYFVPVEHTVRAREVLGPGPLLAPEQAVVLEEDAGRARTIARGFMGHYVKLENYANNLLRLGFAEEELADGGSDRLVDAIVAWGGVERIRARVREHLDAGADHVGVQVLAEDPIAIPLALMRELAPALLA
ncbi:MAG: LLM class F420-dependent oxidoreductase [Actinobacteria bacterium]|nr:LLM class F420-dependent oxidoreductase [Actinomycetota bacterium]